LAIENPFQTFVGGMYVTLRPFSGRCLPAFAPDLVRRAVRHRCLQLQPITVNTSKSVFGHEIPYNKVWAPGGRPMTMFLNHPIRVNGTQVPAGAYTMFLLPAENKWTLIISRSTDTSGRYDEHQDLLRVPMQWGALSSAESTFSVYFAHLAPGECTMRLDLEKSRTWVEFQGKK
jgi:hypothetical protein